MKLKGLVWLFTITLIIISLYQLSFTLVTRNFEDKITQKVESQIKKDSVGLSGDALNYAVKERARIVLDSLQDKPIYPVIGTSYGDCKNNELNLGLDLQGGMNVVLEVGIDQLVQKMSNNEKDPTLLKAIEDANKQKANSGADFITLFANAYKANNPSGRLAPLFVNPNSDEIKFNSSNEEVISVIRKEAKSAFDRTVKIITTRIDKFGVTQPNVNPEEGKGIITVELAGVQNPERVRQLLQTTAKLEFWETYSQQEIYEYIISADEALKIYLKNGSKDVVVNDSATKQNIVTTTTKDSSKLSDVDKLLGGTTDDKVDTAGLTDLQKAELGKKENPLRSLLLGGFQPQQDEKTGKFNEECRISFVYQADTATLNKYLNTDVVKNTFPKTLKFVYGPMDQKDDKGKAMGILYALKKQRANSDKAPIEGDVITDAYNDYDPTSGKPDVNMSMNSVGAKRWETLTGNNIGKPIAIVLDDVVQSAPAPSMAIGGGRSNITGNFTVEQAKDLANVLKTGKLPATAKIVQEQVVGPTLGKEAIAGGKFSFLISFIIIFILMLVYYNTAGWIANIALILNLLFTVGILSFIGATLTAAGIAGLVLTIGLAVDTNVLIFERIKEELDSGKSYENAVDEGYKRSYAPVFDGHLTVFLTALILYIFGLGPVLGFATTQMLGISLSLFCGIMVSRLVTDIYMRKGRHFNYFTKFSRRLFKSFNFKFIEWRKKAYFISIFVLIAGLASLWNGFDYGVEFRGGRSYTVRLDKDVKTGEVRDDLKEVFGDYPIVKTIGNANQVNITTAYKITETDPNRTLEKEVLEKLYNGLKSNGYVSDSTSFEYFGSKIVQSSQTVLPTISDDLKKGAIWATVISLILIAFYIVVRFRRWQYSVGTLIALLHDVLVTLAVFSFFRKIVPFAMEIDQHFIAAVLTVIGFSMNDTVIVFDRIREYFRKRPGSKKEDVINAAINDTMSRTIMTSFTVFITLLILFLVGGEVTKGFSFAMMIGVITGTYSSIFVASPVLVDLDRDNKLTMEEDKEAKIAEIKKQA